MIAMRKLDIHTWIEYTFSSNCNINKGLCGLCFWASDPLIDRFYKNLSIKESEAQKQRWHELLWMLWFDEKSISSDTTWFRWWGIGFLTRFIKRPLTPHGDVEIKSRYHVHNFLVTFLQLYNPGKITLVPRTIESSKILHFYKVIH